MIPVRIFRHFRENLRKCSLQPLVGCPGFEFITWFGGSSHEASGFTLLEIDAPVLSLADADRPLLILDSTWRYLPKMRDSMTGTPVPRSLPGNLETAYPRVAKLSPNPPAGLASIEALYAALRIMGQRDDGLLDAYHWKEGFLDACERAGI